MKRTLSPEEKLEASQLAALWERSKFKTARVQISVLDETDQDGRPIYDFVITGSGRLPGLNGEASLDGGEQHAPDEAP
jgi:hypothetical protein